MVTFVELHDIVVNYYKVHLDISYVDKIYLPLLPLIQSKREINAIIVVSNINALRTLIDKNLTKTLTSLKSKRVYVIIMFMMPENVLDKYYDSKDDDFITEISHADNNKAAKCSITYQVNILHTINNYQASDYFKQLNVFINRKFIEKPNLFNTLISNTKEFKLWYNDLI